MKDVSKAEKIAEFEENFQNHWKEKNWLGIWYDLELVISNIIKRETQHHFRYDLQEIVEEATLTLWSRLKRKVEKEPDYKVKSLVNYCYLPTYFEIHNPKRAFEEKVVNIEEIGEKI